MSHKCGRKDIIFVTSNLEVNFTDETLFEQDAKADEKLFTASIEEGKTETEIEQERAEKVEKLIQENKKPKRTIKR